MCAITPGHALTCDIEWEWDTSWLFMAKTSTTNQELSESRTIAGGTIRLLPGPLAACDIRAMESEKSPQRRERPRVGIPLLQGPAKAGPQQCLPAGLSVERT